MITIHGKARALDQQGLATGTEGVLIFARPTGYIAGVDKVQPGFQSISAARSNVATEVGGGFGHLIIWMEGGHVPGMSGETEAM